MSKDETARATVLVLHGIGNQRPGDTAQLVKERLASQTPGAGPETIAISEVFWSSGTARPSGPRFLCWALKTIPAVVVLGLRSRPAESLSPPKLESISPWYPLFACLFIPLLGEGVQFALLLVALIALAMSIQASWAVPTLSRIALVTVPIAMIGIAAPWALAVTAVLTCASAVLAARRNLLADVWLACDETARMALIERVVAEVAAIRGPIVLLGHSMGAYLALSSLPHLDPRRRRDVRLVTVGSAAAAISCLRAYEQSRSARRQVVTTFALVLCTVVAFVMGMVLLATDWMENGTTTRVLAMALVFGFGLLSARQIDQSVALLEAAADSIDDLHAHPTEWVSVASTHDSVAQWSSLGQGESVSLWTAGSSLPLLEHPLSKYLTPGGLALEVLRHEVEGQRDQSMEALERKSARLLRYAYVTDSARRSVLLVMFTSLFWIGPVTGSFWLRGIGANVMSVLAAGLVGVVAVYVLLTVLQAVFCEPGNESKWGTALITRPDLRARGALSEIARQAIGLALVGSLSAGIAFWWIVALIDDVPGTPPIDRSWYLLVMFLGGFVLTGLSPMPTVFVLAGVWPPLLLLRLLSATGVALLLLLGLAPFIGQVQQDLFSALVPVALLSIPATRVIRRASRLSRLSRGEPLGPGFIERIRR